MIHWFFLIFLIIWIFVATAIFAIGYNLIEPKGIKGRFKDLWISIGAIIVWTLLIVALYKFIDYKLGFVVTFIDNLLNYIWSLIPKIILWWIGLPLAIVYLILGTKGLIYYCKKRFHHSKKTPTKSDEPTLDPQDLKRLTEMAKQNDTSTSVLFRKLVVQAHRNQAKLYVAKLGDNFWIPLFNQDQFKQIEEYAKKLEVDFESLEYPLIVKLSQHHWETFDRRTGQMAFGNEIRQIKSQKE